MIHPDIPVKAISIMQPWAWLIVNGHKDIENRDWRTNFRGPVAIHAGKKVDDDAECWLAQGVHPVTSQTIDTQSPLIDYPYPIDQRGGIVGVAEIVDCQLAGDWSTMDNEWFVGKFGFIIRNARPVPFIPVKGALSFFDWRKNL